MQEAIDRYWDSGCSEYGLLHTHIPPTSVGEPPLNVAIADKNDNIVKKMIMETKEASEMVRFLQKLVDIAEEAQKHDTDWDDAVDKYG